MNVIVLKKKELLLLKEKSLKLFIKMVNSFKKNENMVLFIFL